MKNWKKTFAEIGNIQLFKNGNSIIIWYGNTRHQYWFHTQKDAIRRFKEQYGIKGKVVKANFCPYIIS